MTCGRTGAVRGTFDGAAAVRGRGHMRTRRFGRQALVFLAAAAAFSSPAAAAEASCAHASAVPSHLSTRAASHALLCLVNDARRAHGLPPVGYERHLGAAARRHADDMAAHDFFDHVSPSTGTMESRVQHTGYLRSARAWSLGEAIAWGTARAGRPRTILKGLLASPPPRAILLDPGFRDLGVGVAHGAPSGSDAGALTVALDFGSVQR